LLQLGRDDEALAELTAAALIEPADAQAHALRAQLYLRAGRYQEAAAAARAALARDAASSRPCTRWARHSSSWGSPLKGRMRWRDSVPAGRRAGRDERGWNCACCAECGRPSGTRRGGRRGGTPAGRGGVAAGCRSLFDARDGA
jgi:tetratricopeptide (TPR) repeat protein